MNRFARAAALVSVLALAPMLGGCETFDPTDIFSSDMFGAKKKLPGDRKAVFPEGTPGVSQGVPQELVKGYQEPAPEPPPQAAAEPEEKPKPKPKPKPKVVAKPPPAEESPRAAETVRPTQPQQQWPEPPQQRPATGGWPGSPQGQTAWPDPPSTSR